MYFIIRGIDPKTGNKAKWKIKAADEQAAIAAIKKAGVKDASIKAVPETPPPASKTATTAAPTITTTDQPSEHERVNQQSARTVKKPLWPVVVEVAAALTGILAFLYSLMNLDAINPSYDPQVHTTLTPLGTLIMLALGIGSILMFFASVACFFFIRNSRFPLIGYIAGVIALLVCGLPTVGFFVGLLV